MEREYENVDANLEESFSEHEINDDLSNFEKVETDHNELFGYSQRVACIAHQITCVVRKCVDGSSKIRQILQAAFRLIKVINISGKNKELLLKYNKKRLLSPSQTRWIYTYYVLDRLLESKEAVEKVIVENKVKDVALDFVTWNQLEQIRDLLKPFADVICDLEGDKYSTLSKVIPALMDLMEKFCDNAGTGIMRTLKFDLKQEMDKRFSKIIDHSDYNFSPVHLLATFFDPEYCIGLDNAQQRKCIDFIVSELAAFESEQDRNISLISEEQVTDFSHKKYAGFFKKVQNQHPATSSISDSAKSIKAKLELYIEEVSQSISTTSILSKIDPITYWSRKRELFGDIAQYALNILSVPASSAGIEHIFSLASIVQGGKRQCLGAENSKKELLIKVNRGFLI